MDRQSKVNLLRKLRDELECGCASSARWHARRIRSLEREIYGPDTLVKQDDVVAKNMREFFWLLHDFRRGKNEPDAEYLAEVACRYAHLLWHQDNEHVVGGEKLERSRFSVFLSSGGGGSEFSRITKRTALISDTLLLTHEDTADFHVVGTQNLDPANEKAAKAKEDIHRIRRKRFPTRADGYRLNRARRYLDRNSRRESFGIHCPDLPALGEWLLDAEPLLKAGLAWYLPRYATAAEEVVHGQALGRMTSPQRVGAVDYLVKDGRAIAATTEEPVKSRLVRPILAIDLPFVDGIELREFSKITVEEFSAYSAFRDFMRQRFLDMDEAVDDVRSETELAKLGLQIKDEVRAIRSEMDKVKRKKSLAMSGAAVGTVGAVLVAVYGPALQAAVATLGATGGLWGIIHAKAENTTRDLRDSKWYYVWALMKKNPNHII
ncbi:hypothetical protein [Amycolatopsis albispora]|uniref:hypothetical protein n=1 Tax=Amycolatopsis albispora TaxID=1804986 RepID=UPI0013B3EFD2|nr:hypothetical protein [Amycolatopsis albispora]